MRDVTVSIEGLTAYSASKHVVEDLMKGENKDTHEKRRWREKAHTDDGGIVYIPGVSFKLAIDEVCGVLKEKIKGKGNSTYSLIFRTGVVAISDMPLGVHIDDVKSICIFAHADGKRGPGSRVNRYFPILPKWQGSIDFRIFNDELPESVFERYVEQAGILTGVGRGRPVTGCPAGNGRFRPTKFVWQ